MKHIFLSILALSSTVYAKDSVPIAAEGKVTILFEKDGYLMARHCPDYTIVNSRKDCKAKADLQIMPIPRLKKFLREEVSTHLNTSTTNDKRFSSMKAFSTPSLDEETKKTYQKEVNEMKAYKENFGAKSIDSYKLENFERILKSNEMIDKEVDLAIERIVNESTVSNEVLGVPSMSLELNQRLVGAIRSGPGFIGDGKSCRFSILRPQLLYSVIGADGKILATCSPKPEQYPGFGIEDCKGKCPLPPPFTEVPIDQTADLAISQSQRSIILKDPASVQSGQETKKIGTGKQ